MTNGAPCFDPTCDCCLSWSELVESLELEIEDLRTRLDDEIELRRI